MPAPCARARRSTRQPLSDFDRIRNFVWSSVPAALFDIIWAPLFVVVVFMFHPMLGFVALGGSMVLMCLALAHHIATRPSLEEAGRKAGDANSFMERSLRNAQTLEAMGMLANLQQRWLRQRNETVAIAGEGGGSDRSVHGRHQIGSIPAANSSVGLRRHARDPERDHAGRDRSGIDADGPRARTTRDHDRRVAAVRRRRARLRAPERAARAVATEAETDFPAGARAARYTSRTPSAGFPVTPPRRCGT